MARYTVLTNLQLFVLTLFIGLIAGGVSIAHRMYAEYMLLPQVTVTEAGQCVKVINLENGHAFSCPDVDVLLRRYRKVQ
jgi:hypothetical protein